MFVFLVAQLVFCSCNGRKKNVVWKETIGTICDRGLKASWVCYEVDGKSYSEMVDGWYSNTVIGEKYVMRYNVNDPKDIEIDSWHPVFEENERSFYATGRILEIQHHHNIFLTDDAVIYVFEVHGKRIEKWIELPENYKQLYPSLQEDQLYNVQVWNKNIHRAVLRLDLPIREIKRGVKDSVSKQ